MSISHDSGCLLMSKDINQNTNRRNDFQRIFVVRSLNLEKIKYVGFDMDYTLAIYKSPKYEQETFNLLKDRLINIGYPEEIRRYEYDKSFPVRGLWFDKELGTFLKTDQFGNILLATFGFHILSAQELAKSYPNKFVTLDEHRFHILNSLFHLPETYMLASLVDYLTQHPDYVTVAKGVQKGTLNMSFMSIYQDVRSAMDWVHEVGALKSKTIENIDEFVDRNMQIPIFLDRLHSKGMKTFLLTNSEYHYTDQIMHFILQSPQTQSEHQRPWTSFFDIIIVNAKKPLFFREGTVLRSVDKTTGKLNIGHHIGPFEEGQIYSGGSGEVVSRLMGTRGKDVLYVGDHIYGDILRSKKSVGWRTFLVIPELMHEMKVWNKNNMNLFHQLQSFNISLTTAYRSIDITSLDTSRVTRTQIIIKNAAEEMEQAYGTLGSLFRNGSRQTFFSSQVTRYADLYSHSCLSLMHYPLWYMFRAPAMLMPHEATVTHDQVEDDLETEDIDGQGLLLLDQYCADYSRKQY